MARGDKYLFPLSVLYQIILPPGKISYNSQVLTNTAFARRNECGACQGMVSGGATNAPENPTKTGPVKNLVRQFGRLTASS
jgi:hypothetical protein